MASQPQGLLPSTVTQMDTDFFTLTDPVTETHFTGGDTATLTTTIVLDPATPPSGFPNQQSQVNNHPSTTQPTTSLSADRKETTPTKDIGISIAVAFSIIFIFTLVFYFYRRRRRNQGLKRINPLYADDITRHGSGNSPDLESNVLDDPNLRRGTVRQWFRVHPQAKANTVAPTQSTRTFPPASATTRSIADTSESSIPPPYSTILPCG